MSSSLLSLDPRRPALRPLEGTTFAELRLNGGDFLPQTIAPVEAFGR
ncbi:hypothetical protein GRI72_10770 [Altererythrobacter marinus]|uniref:Uncharacterized protein n=1 Tax=Pelagerythrobacter marinus TaxID=538382 RepID=A0ABW9UYQ3_9SPHN|nr:hypothetical protein [Pelagerythrobacter marinus]